MKTLSTPLLLIAFLVVLSACSNKPTVDDLVFTDQQRVAVVVDVRHVISITSVPNPRGAFQMNEMLLKLLESMDKSDVGGPQIEIIKEKPVVVSQPYHLAHWLGKQGFDYLLYIGDGGDCRYSVEDFLITGRQGLCKKDFNGHGCKKGYPTSIMQVSLVDLQQKSVISTEQFTTTLGEANFAYGKKPLIRMASSECDNYEEQLKTLQEIVLCLVDENAHQTFNSINDKFPFLGKDLEPTGNKTFVDKKGLLVDCNVRKPISVESMKQKQPDRKIEIYKPFSE